MFNGLARINGGIGTRNIVSAGLYAGLGGSMFLVFLFCRFEKTSENAVKEKKRDVYSV